MQNFCKKFSLRPFGGLFWGCLFCLLSVFLGACSDDADPDVVLYPDSELRYELAPNDYANNDSAAAYLAHGIVLPVHPKATYELSFDIDSTVPGAPQLQLFRLYLNSEGTGYRLNQVRSIDPVAVSGRYVYTFTCEESAEAMWVTSLVLHDRYYTGTTSHIHLKGEGAYSDHMKLNLVVVGNVEQKLTDFTLDEFAERLFEGFKRQYSSITIDTMYIRYAHEHATLGKKYPANAPWVAGAYSSDVMMSELGGWPGIENALDIVLVNSINDVGVLGYSNLFSGNMGGGDGSTVVVGAFVKLSDVSEKGMPMDEIVETALHETGHFFGLRHTTATRADIARVIDGIDYGDYSNYEDGLEDTPYCKALGKASLNKSIPQNSQSDIRSRWPWVRPMALATSFSVDNCPDAGNRMFPTTVENREFSFSEQQLEIIKANLKIYPH